MSTYSRLASIITATLLSMSLRGSVDLHFEIFPHLRVALGGDVILGRATEGLSSPVGGDDPFRWAQPWLSQADLSLVNLESPFCNVRTPTLPVPEGGLRPTPRLRANPSAAHLLAGSGIDLVTLANNHVGDCGEQGIRDTRDALDQAGLASAGVAWPTTLRVGANQGAGGSVAPAQLSGNSAFQGVQTGARTSRDHRTGFEDPSVAEVDPFAPTIVERSGVRVAIFAGTTLRNLGQPPSGPLNPVAYASIDQLGRFLPERVRALKQRQEVDLVVVSLHWGREGSVLPDAAQRRLADSLVEAGADLIWGHHSHTLMPMEVQGEGLILYGLGDLVSDVHHHGHRASVLAEVVLARDRSGRWIARRILLVAS